ncbi:MAG: hypothetical protein U1G05_00080 [Kiritimatiellia bacterium]
MHPLRKKPVRIPLILLYAVLFLDLRVTMHCNDISASIDDAPKKHRETMHYVKVIYVTVLYGPHLRTRRLNTK